MNPSATPLLKPRPSFACIELKGTRLAALMGCCETGDTAPDSLVRVLTLWIGPDRVWMAQGGLPHGLDGDAWVGWTKPCGGG